MRIYQEIRLAIYLTVPAQRREGENWGGMPERSREKREGSNENATGRTIETALRVTFVMLSSPFSLLTTPYSVAGAMFLLWRKKLVGS